MPDVEVTLRTSAGELVTESDQVHINGVSHSVIFGISEKTRLSLHFSPVEEDEEKRDSWVVAHPDGVEEGILYHSVVVHVHDRQSMREHITAAATSEAATGAGSDLCLIRVCSCW
jgi:hypothetical protein